MKASPSNMYPNKVLILEDK